MYRYLNLVNRSARWGVTLRLISEKINYWVSDKDHTQISMQVVRIRIETGVTQLLISNHDDENLEGRNI